MSGSMQVKFRARKAVARYPRMRERLGPALAGRLINEIRDIAVIIAGLPVVTASSDPSENYLTVCFALTNAYAGFQERSAKA